MSEPSKRKPGRPTRKARKKLTKESFASALEMHMDRIGLTQADAAALLMVSPRRVWQWLKSERETDYPTQVGVIDILKNTKIRA